MPCYHGRLDGFISLERHSTLITTRSDFLSVQVGQLRSDTSCCAVYNDENMYNELLYRYCGIELIIQNDKAGDAF